MRIGKRLKEEMDFIEQKLCTDMFYLVDKHRHWDIIYNKLLWVVSMSVRTVSNATNTKLYEFR